MCTNPIRSARVPDSSVWLVLSTLVVVLSSISTVAQPALQNAVLNDRGVASRQQERAAVPKDPEGVEVGPVQVTVTASYSLEFNDNVYTSEDDPSGDFIQVPLVSLGVAAPLSQRSDLRFQIGVGYRAYWHNADLSRLTIAPGSLLAYDLQVQDFFLTLFDRFSYIEDVGTAPELANYAQFPRLENTLGAQGTWLPGRFLVAAGYSFRITLSTEEEFDYINGNSHLPFLRAGYVFAEGAANSGLEFSATFTDYESNINTDSTIVSFGPYLDWQLSEAIETSLRGGFLYVNNSITLLPEESFDADSFYLGLDVGHQLTDHISHSLALSHGVRPSFQQGTAFTEETGINYQVFWAFIDPAVLSFNVDYIHGEQTVAAGVAPLEEYDQWRTGVSLSYAWTARLSSTLSYHYIQRDSDLSVSGRNYTRNRVILGVSYRFD